MTPENALIVAVLLPLAGSVVIAFTGSRPNLREACTLVTAGLLFVDVLTLVPYALAGTTVEAVLEHGVAGRTYCVGGSAERSNLQVVETLADILDGVAPAATGKSYREAITFVTDRPGHDWRYAMDISRISAELGWQPARDFPEGLRQTVTWYLKNEGWWRPILAAGQGGDRRGLGRKR